MLSTGWFQEQIRA